MMKKLNTTKLLFTALTVVMLAGIFLTACSGNSEKEPLGTSAKNEETAGISFDSCVDQVSKLVKLN